jgi:PEGA domain
MRKLILFLTLLFAASPALAKPKTKTYPVSCARAWKAVEAVAAGKDYSSSMLDDKRQKAQFVMGHGAWTGKRTLYLTLSGSGDSCEVAVEGVFSGLAHNDKGDLFKRLEGVLTETPSESAPKATESVPTVVTKESPAESEQRAKSKTEMQKLDVETGTIVVNSVPNGAEVYVDGNFVGDAPATLELAPGKHTIRVSLSSYKDWSRELSVLAFSKANLSATLEK